MINSNTLFLLATFAILSCCHGQVQNAAYKPEVDPGKAIFGDTVFQIDSGEIRGIFQDSKNNLWFTSNTDGVFKYDGKTIVNYTEKHGLSSNSVWVGKEGKDGRVWFKTFDHQKHQPVICSFNGAEFEVASIDTARKSYDLKQGELMFGYYFDGRSFSKIELPQTSPLKNEVKARTPYDIYSTFTDNRGNWWFGTATAGVCKYDGSTYTWLDDEELGAPVRDIYEDKKGTIWIGNNGYGLLSYNGKKVTNFTKENKLENLNFIKTFEEKEGTLARVWSITNDNNGNLWIATIDAGVWKFDGLNLTNYTRKDGLGSDAVHTIYKDQKGKLWFGTGGFGVYTFNGKSFEVFKP